MSLVADIEATDLKPDPNVEYLMGIDEAGRGPVLGPMVYACAFCPLKDKDAISKLGFADSKILTAEQREKLFNTMKTKSIGWIAHIISAQELSTQMLRMEKINLNTISHDAAIGLIRLALEKGFKIKEVYVDTVGTASKYQAKLSQNFPEISITVSKKADSLFPIVSAASICAKVTRDTRLEEWKFPEKKDIGRQFGSGYPSDPNTKAWLRQNVDPLFGFPTLIRFSWKTADAILDKAAVPVQWLELEEEEGTSYNVYKEYSAKHSSRYKYFADNSMELCDDF